MFRHEAYLIGMRGEVLHQWTNLPLLPGAYAYVLKNGNLLWAGRTAEGCPLQAGKGGLLREYDWHGNVLWEYRDDNQHHDFRRCETGNTLYLGWEAMRPEAAARVQGGQPGTEHEGVIYGDYVREIDARGTTVWEWHAQDDLDIERYPLHPLVHRDEFAHANACCPLPNGDVMLSFRRLSTIMIIDRTTRKPRWEQRDDAWGMQHDCAMLANGHITLFANGVQHGTESVLAGDRARSRHAPDGVGVSGQSAVDVLQPAHQRRPAPRLGPYADLRGSVGAGVRGHAWQARSCGNTSTRIMGSSVRASWPTRSSAPTATLPIRRKSVGAWARSVPETGAAIRGEEHQEDTDRNGAEPRTAPDCLQRPLLSLPLPAAAEAQRSAS